jgi:hypothetical protein
LAEILVKIPGGRRRPVLAQISAVHLGACFLQMPGPWTIKSDQMSRSLWLELTAKQMRAVLDGMAEGETARLLLRFPSGWRWLIRMRAERVLADVFGKAALYRASSETAPISGSWVTIGCLMCVVIGLIGMWSPWISVNTNSFGHVLRTDGWGQGMHGFSGRTRNPDPVPFTTHAAVAFAIGAGFGVLLWMVVRRTLIARLAEPFIAGLVGSASFAAAVSVAATYARFDRFLGRAIKSQPSMSISMHPGFVITMAGFLAAAVLSCRPIAARLIRRFSVGSG